MFAKAPETIAKGLPLWRAFRVWTHPRQLARLDELQREAEGTADDSTAQREFQSERLKLERQFFLLFGRNGPLYMEAYTAPIVPERQRGTVSSDLVRDMDEWDFDDSACWFYASSVDEFDLHLVRIEVFGPLPAWEVDRLFGPEGAALNAPEAPIALSDDNAVLTVNGEDYVFRGLKQQAILRALYDAYRIKRRLRARHVLGHAESSADSLWKVFNKSPHMALLKRLIRQRDGYIWMENPDSSDSPP